MRRQLVTLLLSFVLVALGQTAWAASEKDVAELIERVFAKKKHPAKITEQYVHLVKHSATVGVTFHYGGEMYSIMLDSMDETGKLLPPDKQRLWILTSFLAKSGMRVRMVDKGLDGVLDTYRSLETHKDINEVDLPPSAAAQNHYDQIIADLLGYYRLAQ